MVLTLFLGSGALGYLFANVYFSLYWSWPIHCAVAIDHRSIFTSLEDKIRLLDSSGNKCQQRLTKRDAWTVVTQFWHSRIKIDKEIEGINPVTDRLTDVTHGLGATSVGLIVAFVSWVGVHSSLSPDASWCNLREISIVIAWLILMILLTLGYRRVNLALQSIVNSTVTSIIQKEFQAQQQPLLIYYVR